MQSLSKKEPKQQGDNITKSLALIFGVMFLVAITIVCFFAPVIDAFDEWMESDIRHGIYAFVGFALIGAVTFIVVSVKRI